MSRRHDPIRLFGIACALAGLLMFASFAAGMWHGYDQQRHLYSVWSAQARQAPVTYTAAGVDPSLKRPVDGVDFAITVPSIGYHAAVQEGVDSGVLYGGPGHYPESRWPGDQGAVGVAAHNVYWIRFADLKPGDEVVLQTRYGDFTYRVSGTRIVNPDDRTVLIPSAPGYHLVLTTCWPVWAGAFANKRFVIFADQVRPAPAPAPGSSAG